jgi:MATE family multidrug resistance protein
MDSAATTLRRVRPSGLNRRILAIAVPAILANLTTVLPGLCDTAFIGRTGDAAEQAGVALGTTFAGLLLWAFGFLRMGTTGVTAQALGAGDPRALRQALTWALALAVGFGGLLVLAAVPLQALALPLYGGGPVVQDFAARYFRLRLLAAPADLALYAMMGWLIGLQRARAVFAIQLLLNSINVAMCWLFVIALDWGVLGVALATVIAQTGTAVIAALACLRIATGLGAAPQDPGADRFVLLKRLLFVNRDIFIRTLALMLVFNVFVHLSAGFEPALLAANQILLGFLAFIANGLDGFAQSAETLVGEAVGARDRRRLGAVLRGNLFWSLGLAAAVTLLLALTAPLLLPLFSSNAAVIAAALRHYPWIAVSPLISVWCFLLDGVFIGATRGRELRDGMLVSAALALGAMVAGLALFGATGLWAALMLFFAVRAVPLALWYRRIPESL